MRLAQAEGAHLHLAESRKFLHDLSRGTLVERCVFFNLDALWYEDLPLAEELNMIVTDWERVLVTIDGFKFPDDAGYGYDDFGEGKVLALELLRTCLGRRELVACPRPLLRKKRVKAGFVVLAQGEPVREPVTAGVSATVEHRVGLALRRGLNRGPALGR